VEREQGKVVEGLMQSLSGVVSDETVRSLFTAAVAEGRPAAIRVCKLFNVLTRRDSRLRMQFQSSLAFWRGGAADRHMLTSLWAMVVGADGELDLRGGAGEVLLTFVRAYSHFLYVQDEDEMFESGRPFGIDSVRAIVLALKRALYSALYVRTPLSAISSLTGESVRTAAGVIRADRALRDEVARLMSRLYLCDSRRPFRTDDNFWIAGGGALASDAFVADAVEAGSEALVAGEEVPEAGYGGLAGGRKAAVLGAGELLRVAPYMAPFASRAKVFQTWVAAERSKFAGPAMLAGVNGRWITVRRNYLFEDAFENLSPMRQELKRGLRVKFRDEHGMDEAGIDGGGVYKEFMFETLRLAFSPSLYSLFAETPEGKLYPSPSAHVVDELYEQRFEFIGALLGKALFDGVIVDIPLASFFLSKLLRKFNYPSDLRSLDPELYKNLMFLRKCDDPEVVDSLGLNFVATNIAFGGTTEVDLVKGGADIPVTVANRIEYIHRVSNYRMNTQIRRQCDAFLLGFSEIIRPEYIQLFSERELQLLISGKTGSLDVDDLRRNTKYSGGYTEGSDVIGWFWRAFGELGAEDQARLLQFVTSSPRAPLLGFAYLNPAFCVHRAEGEARLPTASTCMNLLKLPHYPDYETLRAKLRYSLESNSGFDLS
jgi:ubiquitin-protein ligase E3 C